MVKKNDSVAVGIFESLGVNSNINSENKLNGNENNFEKFEETKPKSTRGRKKKSNETSIKFTGKKVVISKVTETTEKKNKTFYLDSKHIQTLENISAITGMTTSELVEIAIQLLNNNLELDGFND